MEPYLPCLSILVVCDCNHLAAYDLVQNVFIPGAMIGNTKCVLGVLIEGCLSHPCTGCIQNACCDTLASALNSAPLVGILIGITLTL